MWCVCTSTIAIIAYHRESAKHKWCWNASKSKSLSAWPFSLTKLINIIRKYVSKCTYFSYYTCISTEHNDQFGVGGKALSRFHVAIYLHGIKRCIFSRTLFTLWHVTPTHPTPKHKERQHFVVWVQSLIHAHVMLACHRDKYTWSKLSILKSELHAYHIAPAKRLWHSRTSAASSKQGWLTHPAPATNPCPSLRIQLQAVCLAHRMDDFRMRMNEVYFGANERLSSLTSFFKSSAVSCGNSSRARESATPCCNNAASSSACVTLARINSVMARSSLNLKLSCMSMYCHITDDGHPLHGAEAASFPRQCFDPWSPHDMPCHVINLEPGEVGLVHCEPCMVFCFHYPVMLLHALSWIFHSGNQSVGTKKEILLPCKVQCQPERRPIARAW